MNSYSVGRLLVIALLFALAGSGCHSPLRYVSPRIVGCVVDAESQQPIAGVQVRRKSTGRSAVEAPHGAEMLREAHAVVTDGDGSFDITSKRDLVFFRRVKWSAVTLIFTQRGYQTYVATFTSGSSTNAPDGEPLVLAGNISLRPLNRENSVKQLAPEN